jgi:hypothetical protein
VQWQAMVSKGLALTFNRTCPQRQPPSQGSSSVVMILSPPVFDDISAPAFIFG